MSAFTNQLVAAIHFSGASQKGGSQFDCPLHAGSGETDEGLVIFLVG